MQSASKAASIQTLWLINVHRDTPCVTRYPALLPTTRTLCCTSREKSRPLSAAHDRRKPSSSRWQHQASGGSSCPFASLQVSAWSSCRDEQPEGSCSFSFHPSIQRRHADTHSYGKQAGSPAELRRPDGGHASSAHMTACRSAEGWPGTTPRPPLLHRPRAHSRSPKERLGKEACQHLCDPCAIPDQGA